jgi:hypothetical protein
LGASEDVKWREAAALALREASAALHYSAAAREAAI